MAIGKYLNLLVCAGSVVAGSVRAEPEIWAGPLLSDFQLTLSPGERVEAFGPFWYSQRIESEHQFGLPPVFSYTRDPDLELTEFDMAYPVLTYRRYGGEYRWQLYQWLSWAGGKTQNDETDRRFTLFPIYFQQRNTNNPSGDYTAVVPFYGTLKHRFYRDYIHFVMFPFYSETHKKDLVTYNYVYPFYHTRTGNNLKGKQVWPFWGHEVKGVTYRTNQLDELEVIGGHDHYFAAFPFYLNNKDGIGTENPQDAFGILPFYSETRSPLRDSTSYGWPFGYTHTIDRDKKYEERDFLWPLYVFAHGQGKNETRVFPIFSHGVSTNIESHWYAWPIYKVNYLHAAPLERKRTRIVYFLYSDVVERNTDTMESLRRIDLWPLFLSRRAMNGDRRVQVLAILEPIMPNNKTVPREYAPVYSLWRSEYNAKTRTSSQSLLWNLYRRERSPEYRRTSVLFGLLQQRAGPNGSTWKLLFIPVVKTSADPALGQ